MRLTLIFQIEGLKVENLNRPFTYSLMPLINGSAEIKKTLELNFVDQNAFEFFGFGALNRLATKPFFIMIINASPENIDYISTISERIFFTHVEIFLDSLWFIKDNSCHSLICYHAIHEKGLFGIIHNYRFATNCVGGKEDVSFTSEEFDRALELDKKLQPIINLEMDDSMLRKMMECNFQQGMENTQNYNRGDRINRAYYFLKAARNSYFIVMKLSLYMNMYECLFTTDASEIIHKMSERVACYYTQDKEKRLEVFKIMKSAYGIRSRYFHGKDLGKNKIFDTIPAILKQLDNLTREVFTRVVSEDFEIFLKPDMEPFFERLIFS